MKSVAILSLLLSFSASAAGTAWQNLEIGDHLSLSQSLGLDAKAAGKIQVRKSTPYALDSITPLDGIDVLDYVFVTNGCKLPNLEGELTMVLPAGNSPTSKADVGVYFLKGCALEVLVEIKDLATPSFFNPAR